MSYLYAKCPECNSPLTDDKKGQTWFVHSPWQMHIVEWSGYCKYCKQKYTWSEHYFLEEICNIKKEND